MSDDGPEPLTPQEEEAEAQARHLGKQKAAKMVGERLDYLRISPEDAAKAAGIGGNTVRRLVNGVGWPHPRSLRAISTALGWAEMTIERVVQGRLEPEPFVSAPKPLPPTGDTEPLTVNLEIAGVDWAKVDPLDRRVIETAMLSAGLEKYRQLSSDSRAGE